MAAGSGLLVGGAAGIVRSTSPVLFAAASGVQWFALGTSFWAARDVILHRHGLVNWFHIARGAAPQYTDIQPPTSKDKVVASTIGGAFAGGSTAALLRGRANVIPGIIMFSVIGAAGQSLYNTLDRQHTEEVVKQANQKNPPENFLQRIAKSRFSPMKVLSDEEYSHMLEEKLLQVEADIAIIDENIENLKKQVQEKPNKEQD